MDTKAMIRKLNSIFCEKNKSGACYTKVWLSDVDFGGLYRNEMYVLNVQAEHEIDSRSTEIGNIIKFLDEKASDELKVIWRVNVHNSNEEIRFLEDELIVLDDGGRCKPVMK